jgi:intracellular multiplication protein IcmD
MLSSNVKKALVLLGSSAILLLIGTAVYATSGGATGTPTGIGKVAGTVQSNFAAIALFITSASYIGGLAFGVGAVLKFKAHKDNPTQVALSVPIALLFIAAALMFIPSVFKSAGQTLYGTSGSVAGISGITNISAT